MCEIGGEPAFTSAIRALVPVGFNSLEQHRSSVGQVDRAFVLDGAWMRQLVMFVQSQAVFKTVTNSSTGFAREQLLHCGGSG